DHCEASLRRAQIGALIVPRGEFRARLTWAELQHLQVLRCEDNSPRITYVQLGPGLTFVTFTSGSEALSVWRGREMRADDIMFHSRGERLHESTSGPSVWNVIAMDPAKLERYWRDPLGKALFAPADGRVLRPSTRLAARVRRLHAQICCLAETKSKIVSHPEAARAM